MSKNKNRVWWLVVGCFFVLLFLSTYSWGQQKDKDMIVGGKWGKDCKAVVSNEKIKIISSNGNVVEEMLTKGKEKREVIPMEPERRERINNIFTDKSYIKQYGKEKSEKFRKKVVKTKKASTRIFSHPTKIPYNPDDFLSNNIFIYTETWYSIEIPDEDPVKGGFFEMVVEPIKREYEVTYLNKNGEIYWTKYGTLETESFVSHNIEASTNGNRVLLPIHVYGPVYRGEGEYITKFVVYDKKGDKVITLQNEKLDEPMMLTRDGKYLIGNEKGKSYLELYLIFFDIDKGTSKRCPYNIKKDNPYEILENGEVIIYPKDSSPKRFKPNGDLVEDSNEK